MRKLWAVLVGCSVGSALLLQDVEAQSLAPLSQATTLARPAGELSGTLLLPRASGPVPVVLLIAGSGPTDRDGNGGGFGAAPLRQLAESLAVRQIATLRYDKRGVGQSRSAAVAERDLRFETFAEDARAWIDQLAADRRFSRVIVAGHSEGALLGLLALKGSAAGGYISLEGAARSIDEVLHEQFKYALPPQLLPAADSALAKLKAGQGVDTLPPLLQGTFRNSVQPYMMSWMRYSGQAELAALTLPCLVVQGSHDFQVDPSEGERLAKANPGCRMARIEGMNHVLKPSPADRMAQIQTVYPSPDIPLAPGLVDAVAAFVRGIR